MNQITDLMRTGRGLCASFDPAAGPERAAAFKADVLRLFTAPSAPVVPTTDFKSGDEVRITIEPAEVTAPHDGRCGTCWLLTDWCCAVRSSEDRSPSRTR